MSGYFHPSQAGLTGYIAGQEMQQRRAQGNLQQAQGLMGLQQAMEKQRIEREGGQRNEALRAAIAALPPEKRTRENVLPLLLQHGALKEALPMMEKVEQPRGQPIGSGGLLRPDGTIVAPAARPVEARPSPIGSGGLRMPDGTIVPPATRPPQAQPIGSGGLRLPDGTVVPPAARPGTATPKAPVGFRFKEDGSLESIPGGPRDPTLNLAGGRESVYVQRMMMGANQAAKDLANVVQLPLTASTGIFGGRRQGAGLFDAGKEVLANKATQQEAQAYNAMATGFQRSLAQIESAGLMPSGALTHQMDAVLFKEGDTNLTKLHKLAQTRQIVEAGMEVIEANPRVSPEEKAKIKAVLQSIRQSVPFTHSDLIRLQVEQEKNPSATLKSVIDNKPKWEVVR